MTPTPPTKVTLRENPLKVLRLEAGLTQQDIAHELDCSRLLVLRSEQGVYALPPPHLIHHLAAVAKSPLDYNEIMKAYKDWQRLQRRAHGPLSSPDSQAPALMSPFAQALSLPITPRYVSPGPTQPVPAHPLVRLRTVSGLSQIGLCVQLCVNPGPIHKFESFKQRQFPSQLLYALQEAGYAQADIDYLTLISEASYDSR